MADNIIKLRIESSEYEQKLKRAADGLQRFGEEAHQVGKAIDLADKEQANYIRMIGQMETVNRSARGKINELSNAFVELSSQYRHLTDEEKNSPFGEALSSSIEQLKQRVQDGKKELEDINRELNATSNEGQETGGAMKQLADRFTINIDAMKLFDIGLKAINGALGVAKDAFFASEANVDEWGRTIESAQSVYNGFLNAINTGDISGFLSNINDIIIAARNAYDELDKLGTLRTIQTGEVSGQQAENERLRAMLRTGKGISSLGNTGRFFDMAFGIKNGQDLSEVAIRAIEARLKRGTDKIVELTKNEINQANRSIDAFYEKLALDNGMSLAEFRQGTSSWSEFSKRIEEYNKYKAWQDNAARDFYAQGGQGFAPTKGNPYEAAKKWGVFRVDGEEFQKLVQLIQQRDAQARTAYGLQMQAYRAINTVDNRLTPSGGGGGGGRTGGGTPAVTEVRELTGLIEIQQQKVKDLQTQIAQAPSESIITYLRGELQVAQDELDRLNGKTKEFGETVTQEVNSPLIQMTNVLKQLNEELMLADTPEAYQEILADIKAINQEMDAFKGVATTDMNKDAKQTENSWKAAANAVQSVGSALQQIDDPGAKIVGLIGQAIANIALGFAQATAASSGAGIFGWIAAIAGGLATMTSTIAAIHSATGYAEGGIVKGTTFSGDQIPADSFVNAGELILNRSQQNSIASQLQDSTRGSNGIARVSGEQIYIAINAYLRRSGKGELVTWK